MALTKKFLKSKPVCKVTFQVEKESFDGAKKVALVGDFNEWNAKEPIVLKSQKNGTFKTVVDLDCGKEYEFRYIVNGQDWTNDPAADKYVASPFGVENSVVSI